jgi:hypothetical protein
VLYKHGLAQTVYLELMQQKKPLELIFKLYEVTKPNRYAVQTWAGPGGLTEAQSAEETSGAHL